METNVTTATPADTTNASHNVLHESYLRWDPAYQALPKEDLLAVNVDPTNGVTIVRGSLKGILALRERCAEELPKEDLTVFDVVESQALGLAYAKGRHQSALRPNLPLPELSEQGALSHDILGSGIRFAIKRGVLNAQILRDMKGPVGYRNLASDLVAFVTIYRDNQKALDGRTGVSTQDVNDAEALAYQLLGAIGERDHQPATVAATQEALQRAFTLFMRTYDAIRRIATYLCWNDGNVDEVAPSVYAGRKRKGSDLSEPETPAEPTASAGDDDKGATPAAANGTRAAVGMPGSSPFVSGE